MVVDEMWICLESVSFIRRQRLILDQISWNIASGNNWVVLGANGSGKTTLLQLLAGMTSGYRTPIYVELYSVTTGASGPRPKMAVTRSSA